MVSLYSVRAKECLIYQISFTKRAAAIFVCSCFYNFSINGIVILTMIFFFLVDLCINKIFLRISYTFHTEAATFF